MDLPTALLAALLCAEVAAVVLAVRHAREPDRAVEIAIGTYKLNPQTAVRFRRWRWRLSPLVALLTFALVDELAQAALHAALDGAPRPLAGWYRAGWHVSIALSLGWPAVLAWACWPKQTAPDREIRGRPGSLSPGRGMVVAATTEPHRGGWFARRRGSVEAIANVLARGTIVKSFIAWRSTSSPGEDILFGAFLGALAGLAIVYPPSRAGLRWTLLAWELLCTALAWWGLWRARLRTWGAVEVCLVVLVSCETMVATVGPFASDPFLRWWIARCFYLGAWGAVCGVLIKRRE